eukprot:CAMPEP_0116954686 /NCGR_PEP_ID=MMETSP0467-20121206/42121_1 /TAXON_ID=283647 /ORGANISM="Mesodinium pulex, Strain SPMC105" /LENGTH=188 /DNA_ID=CAMNT_0004640487 /DNA_START=458 /DNA_END=1024 /DNA_ORIENTATION=+
MDLVVVDSLRTLDIFFFLRFQSVAFAGVMGFPRPHAEPAEFTFAHGTGHVVAALVLLDVFVAVWTRFGVYFDPAHVEALSFMEGNPLLGELAVARQVTLRHAVEAEALGAGAVDGGAPLVTVEVDDVAAVVWALAERALSVHKRFLQKLILLLQQLGVGLKRGVEFRLLQFDSAVRVGGAHRLDAFVQ